MDFDLSPSEGASTSHIRKREPIGSATVALGGRSLISNWESERVILRLRPYVSPSLVSQLSNKKTVTLHFHRNGPLLRFRECLIRLTQRHLRDFPNEKKQPLFKVSHNLSAEIGGLWKINFVQRASFLALHEVRHYCRMKNLHSGSRFEQWDSKD